MEGNVALDDIAQGVGCGHKGTVVVFSRQHDMLRYFLLPIVHTPDMVLRGKPPYCHCLFSNTSFQPKSF